MSNITKFMIGGRNFIINEAPAGEIIDLYLATKEIFEAKTDGENTQLAFQKDAFKSYLDRIQETTFIMEELSGGRQENVTKASFLGLKNAKLLMDFANKISKIINETMEPVVRESSEKKSESKESLNLFTVDKDIQNETIPISKSHKTQINPV